MTHAACARAIRAAIAAGSASKAPAACWRIGPLRLGMGEAAVSQAIGAPFVRKTIASNQPGSGRRFLAALYAVPHVAVIPFGRDRPWFLGLRFEAGRLVAIDTAVDTGTTYGRCPSLRNDPDPPIVPGRPQGPLTDFATIRVGDRLSLLRRVFGRLPDGNRSRDWFAYWPVPISFGVDGRTITAIAIATDAEAMMDQPRLAVVETRDPATCRPVSVRYGLE